jgi:RHS repeat-associated protein
MTKRFLWLASIVFAFSNPIDAIACEWTTGSYDAYQSSSSYCASLNGFTQSLERLENTSTLVFRCNWPASIYNGSVYFGSSYVLNCPSGISGAPSGAGPVSDQAGSSCGGSIIKPEVQSVGETVPLAGTSFSLNYSSARQLGSTLQRENTFNVYEAPCDTGPPDTGCYPRDVTLTLPYSNSTTSFSPGTPGPLAIAWSGLDSSGNVVLGARSYTISIDDIPTTPYVHAYPLVYKKTFSSFYAMAYGLGGWTVSDHHFYDKNLKMLFRGDGEAVAVTAQVLSGPTYLVTSSDGSEVYVFDSNGVHTSTKTGVKGATKYSFAYSSGKLSTITDAFSNVTTFNYSSGNLSSVVGPYGHTTTFTVNSYGYLSSITNPASESYDMTYYGSGLGTAGDGLLATFEKPNGVVSTMTYDSKGRLLSDSSSAGSGLSLSILSPGVVATTTSEGVATQFSVGGTAGATRTTQVPSKYSFYETYGRNQDEVSYITGVDPVGWSFTRYFTVDPRTPSAKFVSSFQKYAGTINHHFTVSKSATLSDSADMFSVVDLTTTEVLNSTKTTTTSYLASTSKYTRTSPVGRLSYLTVDSHERPTAEQFATYTPFSYSYDSNGRLSTVGQGTSRTTTFTYDSSGNLASVTNPLSQVTSYAYDSVGRNTQTTLPDSRAMYFTYDVNGNLASVTPPSGLAHTFLSNGFDLLSKYTAPAVTFMALDLPIEKLRSVTVGVLDSVVRKFADFLAQFFPSAAKKVRTFTVNRDTQYAYDNDRRLTSITRPDSGVATFSYGGPRGNLTGITTPIGNYTFVQQDYHDVVDQSTSPDGVVQNYTYLGDLLTQADTSGTSSGSLYLTYNNELLVATTKVNTSTPISYGYDNDNLLTTAGSLSVARNSTTGLVTNATLSNVSENYTYSTSFGELTSIQGKYSSSTNIYNTILTRDDLARVVSKVETIGSGSADTYAYTYDSAGRLTTVTKNAASYSSYVYDSNSNRTSVSRASGNTTSTYDEQDRLLTSGTKTYDYNDAGEMTGISDSSTSPASVTSYTYDVFGNLKSVSLPGGSTISYLLDGQQRRVARKVAGVVQKKFVWLDGTRIAAELDSSGVILSQFVYGTKANAPDYIIKGSTQYKVITDHLGSVVAVADASTGAVAQAISYDEFGRVLSDTNPGFQPFGFAGGLSDSDTGLVLFGARSYDAETGRWLSKDPILFGGGDTNLYGYVLNDPINLIDSTGRFPSNLDEAGECLFGNTDALNAVQQANIDENNRQTGNTGGGGSGGGGAGGAGGGGSGGGGAGGGMCPKDESSTANTNTNGNTSQNKFSAINEALSKQISDRKKKCRFFPTIN